MSTVHINAQPDDFAKNILLPGDPLRAKYIANKFLTDAKEVTNIRNMLGFTGYYKDKRISTMGTGMGMSSCNIYAKELITNYKVENLIRIGTAGTTQSSGLKLKDIVLASGACTDSNANRLRFGNIDFSAVPCFKLLYATYTRALADNVKVRVGNCFTTDYFYHPLDSEIQHFIQKMGVLCIEMETAGLYGTAFEYKAHALSILSISDVIDNRSLQLTAEERQESLDGMITLALDTATSL